MSKELKLCINCKHHEVVKIFDYTDQCARIRVRSDVNGNMETKYKYCTTERMSCGFLTDLLSSDCGPKGKYYVGK